MTRVKAEPMNPSVKARERQAKQDQGKRDEPKSNGHHDRTCMRMRRGANETKAIVPKKN